MADIVYYYLNEKNVKCGPLQLQQLSNFGVTSQTPVWREGLSSWVPAGSLPELTPYLAAARPPVYQNNTTQGGSKNTTLLAVVIALLVVIVVALVAYIVQTKSEDGKKETTPTEQEEKAEEPATTASDAKKDTVVIIKQEPAPKPKVQEVQKTAPGTTALSFNGTLEQTANHSLWGVTFNLRVQGTRVSGNYYFDESKHTYGLARAQMTISGTYDPSTGSISFRDVSGKGGGSFYGTLTSGHNLYGRLSTQWGDFDVDLYAR